MGADQRKMVEISDDADRGAKSGRDSFINLDYLDSISFKIFGAGNVRKLSAPGMRRSFRNLPCSMRF